MYIHATPIDFESVPVHGACPVDAPRVPVALRLELTQEEAASVLAAFTVGLSVNDPRICPADTPQILAQVITDVALQAIREAALNSAEGERAYPEDGPWYEWCRRIVRPVVPQQRAQGEATPALTGTAAR